MKTEELKRHLKRLRGRDIAPRIKELSRLFLGTDYKLHPLNDEDELYNWQKVDCVTFVEQVLALSFIDSMEQFLKVLISIRYREGQVDFYHRNHFFSADWVPNNRAFLRTVEPEGIEFISREIDRERFFQEKGYVPPED